ncbi:MAG: hypothetical protein NDJ89_18655 [Oligoflexia bacterium]|nr:hypothetical protein [Oligoflexia bacterium]
MKLVTDSTATSPTFNLPELQQAFQEHAQAFDTYEERITKMSADIVALEKYLSSRGVGIEYTLKTREHRGDYEGLQWSKDKNGKFRLLYVSYAFYPHPEGDGEGTHDHDSRPLIETPLKTRIEMFKFLGMFVHRLAAQVSTNQYPATSQTRAEVEAEL